MLANLAVFLSCISVAALAQQWRGRAGTLWALIAFAAQVVVYMAAVQVMKSGDPANGLSPEMEDGLIVAASTAAGLILAAVLWFLPDQRTAAPLPPAAE